MKGWLKLAIVTGLGAIAIKGWREWMGEGKDDHPATPLIRDAGPAEQQGIAARDWDLVDEQADESFPASDPPGNFRGVN